MATIIEINSYDEFDKFVVPDNGVPVYFYFTGKKDNAGKSWCPDCVVAEPVLKDYLNSITKNIILVYTDVGEREYWKNKECPFRTDSRCRLMQIPTIFKWKGVQRLEGTQCGKPDLLRMVFEDEE